MIHEYVANSVIQINLKQITSSCSGNDVALWATGHVWVYSVVTDQKRCHSCDTYKKLDRIPLIYLLRLSSIWRRGLLSSLCQRQTHLRAGERGVREARRCLGLHRPAVHCVEGWSEPLWLRLAFRRQRSIPGHHPQASVWRRPAWGPHTLQISKPNWIPTPYGKIWSFLLQGWDWNTHTESPPALTQFTEAVSCLIFRTGNAFWCSR